MKVLIIHNRYKQYGGEDTVVEQEFQAYKTLGHDVRLYIKNNTELRFFDLLLSIFNPLSFLSIRKEIKDFKPDIVHIHNIIFKLSPSILWAIPKGVKSFMTIHNYRMLCPSGTLFFNGSINTESRNLTGLMRNIVKGVYQNSLFKTLVLTLIYRLNLWLGTFDRVDEYIFLTPFSKKLHCDWMPRRFLSSRVKPNFIMEEYTIHDTDKAIDVLFVGRFTPEKGILDVLPTLISKKALKIDLVGDGPEFNAVKDTVKNHNHITLHGSKTRKEVLKLLESTRFLLFPSIWYEGMPVTILEAYAKSVPVISRNLGAMSSMVIDQVTGFHYNSNEHLKEILLTLDTCDYRKLSHGAYHEFNLKYNRQNGLENITQLIYEGNS